MFSSDHTALDAIHFCPSHVVEIISNKPQHNQSNRPISIGLVVRIPACHAGGRGSIPRSRALATSSGEHTGIFFCIFCTVPFAKTSCIFVQVHAFAQCELLGSFA
ncbi:uncharacterized protein B0I36DRAFT_324814 [Microdochium trichocladiopsis]|uniref:Uncharacterized protein n=1 Tax=Microdochium trichocladiopsis TaxID=1682393 RepID=A0A9P9BLV6_9PEZI|nr:uncharacterized protein B0I36DRAFT_324814 [Microdochium trichocladiopsis]KAH7028988.1 hypothetical protein B0I36DRAFT_324814 [Microdochium trichocladiopsis]